MRRPTRILRTTALAAAALLALGAAAIQLSGHGYFWRALAATYLQGHTTAHIDDASNFAQRTIAAGAPRPWPTDPRLNRDPLDPATLAHLTKHGTAAFLVAQDGALLHESYYAPYDADSRTNSFSVAKTITTMLVGLAVREGMVSGFDAPLIERLPEYADDPRGRRATVSQLSAMKAGHDWDEHYYLPLNVTTELYFGGDAAGLVLRRGFERDPGSAFEYSSGSTQLIGVFLQRALAAREPGLTIAEHLSRGLWKPLGMGRDAIWTLDRAGGVGGIERTYCCVFATARDFARLGQLLLQDGEWDGRPLLDRAFVERMRTPDLVPYYGHSLWMDLGWTHPFWFMQGHQGQYVIVVPSKRLVVVRTGRFRDLRTKGPNGVVPAEVYRYVEQAVALAAR
ncbi:MAG: serine hydrolase [Burkholderiaceae bacterium]|jgi:CubicO group peptidase (beta-lactamase class C family)|nr:serine hydrolase [Burkholderiales bacterium]MCZ8101650.1 serine hydrolase [Burkholderiales bacterium]MCZ8341343.1 serine hydrolase [Burkholderiaceae bacterium]